MIDSLCVPTRRIRLTHFRSYLTENPSKFSFVFAAPDVPDGKVAHYLNSSAFAYWTTIIRKMLNASVRYVRYVRLIQNNRNSKSVFRQEFRQIECHTVEIGRHRNRLGHAGWLSNGRNVSENRLTGGGIFSIKRKRYFKPLSWHAHDNFSYLGGLISLR